jgi:hypothetical protein
VSERSLEQSAGSSVRSGGCQVLSAGSSVRSGGCQVSLPEKQTSPGN